MVVTPHSERPPQPLNPFAPKDGGGSDEADYEGGNREETREETREDTRGQMMSISTPRDEASSTIELSARSQPNLGSVRISKRKLLNPSSLDVIREGGSNEDGFLQSDRQHSDDTMELNFG